MIVIGKNIQVKTGATPAWGLLCTKPTKLDFTEKDMTAETKLVDGTVDTDKAGEDFKIKISYANLDKATVEAIRALSGLEKEWYIPLGKIGSYNEEIYVKAGKAFMDVSWSAPGSTSLERGILIQGVKQSSPVSVTPSSGLPASAYSAATETAVTSDNNWYLQLRTAVS